MLHANQVWGHLVTSSKCYRLKMGRKWTVLNQYTLVNTDFDGKCFVVFEHTINRFSFGYVCLPQSEYYFSFSSFFLRFFFSSVAIYF